MLDQETIRSLLLLFSLLFVAYVFFRKKQDARLNWALFFSSLWAAIFLILANWIAIDHGLWSYEFTETSSIFIPYDLYFVWLIFWGLLMPFILKGKYIWLTTISLFWLDILVMPQVEQLGILHFSPHWLWGELLLVLVAYMPAHLWVYLFLEKKHAKLRTLLQFFCIAALYTIGIPFMVSLYFPESISVGGWTTPYILQLAFMILLPSLIALIDLAEKGKGTPFPYDPTQHLVQSGVYAYIRNPIQWSLTLLFIPLALFYHSVYLLAGLFVSVGYVIGISNLQEGDDMAERFSESWKIYKKNVPAWHFLWRPLNMPVAEIYFRKNCGPCSEIRAWFEGQNPIHLSFIDAEDFEGERLLQVSYKDHQGEIYTSVKAIAHALEHINLAWASLGWFMRLPGISYLLQAIVDAVGPEVQESEGGKMCQ